MTKELLELRSIASRQVKTSKYSGVWGIRTAQAKNNKLVARWDGALERAKELHDVQETRLRRQTKWTWLAETNGTFGVKVTAIESDIPIEVVSNGREIDYNYVALEIETVRV